MARNLLLSTLIVLTILGLTFAAWCPNNNSSGFVLSQQGKTHKNKRSFWNWTGFSWGRQVTNELYYKVDDFTPDMTGRRSDPTINGHDGRYAYTLMTGATQYRGFGWYWPSWYWSRVEYKLWYYRHWNAYMYSWRHISPWKRSYGQWMPQNWGYRTEHV